MRKYVRQSFDNLILLVILMIAWLPILTSARAHPVYNNSTPIFLGVGQSATVWNAETPIPGTGNNSASQQVGLTALSSRAGTPFSVDGKFSGAPGTFEVDVQVANTDSDANYQTCSNCNITTVDSTNNTFHLDAVLVNARFARLLMRSRGNSVNITATFTGG
jgi:hypothetical protein